MKLIKGGGQKDTDWGFEQSGYKQDGYYTASTDGAGHSELLHVKFPQGIPERMAAVVSQIKHYRSTHDLVRDAVIHRMKYLNEKIQDGSIDNELDLVTIEQELTRTFDRLQRTENFIESLPDRLKRAKKVGDRNAWNQVYDSALAIGHDSATPDGFAQQIIEILKEHQWS